MSYCHGCIGYVNIYCTECGRSKLTEDEVFQTEHLALSQSGESQTEESLTETLLQVIQNYHANHHIASSE